MANIRQYIGARYVTKIYENSLDSSSAEWESGVTYEPLTLVTYLNSSYLSKKNVPGSIGNPASNPSYWVVTGAYNGQIATLQNQINTIINTYLPTIQGDIDTLTNTTIPAIQSNISNINDEIAELKRGTSVKKLMVITDSYGNQLDSNNKSFIDLIAETLNITCSKIAVSGGSIHAGEIEAAVSAYSGSTDFDTVLILTGANDETNSDIESSIISGMQSLVTTINSKFNSPAIFCMCPGMTFDSTYYTASRMALARWFKNACRVCNIKYVDNSQYILCATTRLKSDKCHPNDEGIKWLAHYACDYIVNGSIDVIITGNYTDDAARNYWFVRHNGHIQVNIKEASGVMCYKVSEIDGTGATFENFANLNNTMVEANGNSGADCNNLFGYCIVGSNEERLVGAVTITDGHIKAYCKNKSATNSTNNRLIGNLIFND